MSRCHCYDKDYDPIIIDEGNMLIDGYTTYLIFAQQGIKRVAAYKIGVRLEEVQYGMQ